MTQSVSRRRLFETLALAAAGTLVIRRGVAEQAAKLDPEDPAAKALGYVENAGQVDIKKYPSYVKGSRCDNCLQLQGKSGDEYRPCTLFNGKQVAAAGWCSGWTAEM